MHRSQVRAQRDQPTEKSSGTLDLSDQPGLKRPQRPASQRNADAEVAPEEGPPPISLDELLHCLLAEPRLRQLYERLVGRQA